MWPVTGQYRLILIVLIIQLCLADRDLLIDDCLISSEVSVGLLLEIPDGLNVSWCYNITTSNCLVWKLWTVVEYLIKMNWCVTVFGWQVSKSIEIPQSYKLGPNFIKILKGHWVVLWKGLEGQKNLFVQYFTMDELMYKESISRQDTPQSHAIVASQTDVSSEWGPRGLVMLWCLMSGGDPCLGVWVWLHPPSLPPPARVWESQLRQHCKPPALSPPARLSVSLSVWGPCTQNKSLSDIIPSLNMPFLCVLL